MTFPDELEAMASAVEALESVGIPPDRIPDLVGPEGIIYRRVTDDELDALAGDRDAEVYEGGPKWRDLTDAQLMRIESGADPREVA